MEVTELEITLTPASSPPAPLRQYAGLMDSFLLLAERWHVEAWPQRFHVNELVIWESNRIKRPQKASKLRFLRVDQSAKLRVINETWEAWEVLVLDPNHQTDHHYSQVSRRARA